MRRLAPVDGVLDGNGDVVAESEGLLAERVRSLVEPVLARHGAELIELKVQRGRTHLVRLTVDREDGIDLGTCAKVSSELSRLLDADDPMPGRYTLEVSSPGADRPMKTERDFRRNVGRRVRIVTPESQHEGTLEEVQPERIRLSNKNGEEWIDLAGVASAKVVLPW